jgi:hypothetical protein
LKLKLKVMTVSRSMNNGMSYINEGGSNLPAVSADRFLMRLNLRMWGRRC